MKSCPVTVIDDYTKCSNITVSKIYTFVVTLYIQK